MQCAHTRRDSFSPPRCRRRFAPPPLAIRHLKTSQWERGRHQDRAARVKAVLNAAGLPVMPNDTHIVPVMVGDPENCEQASDVLLAEHGIYIQPINYPTVPARHRAAAHHSDVLSR
jgi:5-aminolevulinate synthase